MSFKSKMITLSALVCSSILNSDNIGQWKARHEIPEQQTIKFHSKRTKPKKKKIKYKRKKAVKC